MDPSDSHQHEGVTAQNISPVTTPTLNELNRVEAQVEPQVQPEAQPQAPSEAALVPAQPSWNHRPYTDMIYDAVAALNEPPEWAISRYIKMFNPNLPDSHGSLMTHHLKVMVDVGLLTKVNQSYKLADSSPPEENMAVAAAAVSVDAGPVAASGSGPLDPVAAAVMVAASGSEIPPAYTSSLAIVAVSPSGSASQPLKRGRGRPPKPKTIAPQQQQPIDAQPISQVPQTSSQPSREQPELHVTNPTQVVTESAKKRAGLPRKDGSGPSVSTANLAVMMKQRGWPMSYRAAGRERKPVSVLAPAASVIPIVARGGVGRPEEPMRSGSGGAATFAPDAGVEAMAVAAVMKRGRGRPPKRGGGRGLTAGRPIQVTPRPVVRATGTTKEADYVGLKRNLDLANEKVKEILSVLNIGIKTGDNQAAVQAAQELDELIQIMIVELQAIEEVQPEKATPLIEAETQGMELGQGSGGGGEQAQIQTLTHPEPNIAPEFPNLPEIERLPELNLDPLTLTQPQPQPQILPQTHPNTEAEALDEDMF